MSPTIPRKVPTSFVVAMVVLLGATLTRGVLGSLVAGILISLIVLLLAATATTKPRKFMRRLAIGLAVYGGAFAVQAVALPTYVGSRLVDGAWGLLVVAVAAFLYLSKELAAYLDRVESPNPAGGGDGRMN
jgi:hypothetical protein